MSREPGLESERFPKWWRRFGYWAAPALALPVGVDLIAAGHAAPLSWGSLGSLVAGMLLLFLIPAMIVSAGEVEAERRASWQRTPASRSGLVPPGGVRAVLRDGTVVPIACRYVGQVTEPDGQLTHVWVAVHRLGERPERFEVDSLPPATTVIAGTVPVCR